MRALSRVSVRSGMSISGKIKRGGKGTVVMPEKGIVEPC